MAQFQTFFLILIRVSVVLFMMPLFNSRNLPARLKACLALTVSLILLPVVWLDISTFPADPFYFFFFLIQEGMIGFILGLSVRLIFGGIQLAGEIAGFQMGLAMANIVDPQSGMNITVIAEFYYLLALLIFLVIDGHHWFFRALVQSFHLLPPGGFALTEGLFQHLVHLSGKMFSIALRIVAPVMAILILTKIALGIVSRMVPQVNILISSFPLTISLGLIFSGLSMEFLWPSLKTLLNESGKGLGMTLLPLMKR